MSILNYEEMTLESDTFQAARETQSDDAEVIQKDGTV